MAIFFATETFDALCADLRGKSVNTVNIPILPCLHKRFFYYNFATEYKNSRVVGIAYGRAR